MRARELDLAALANSNNIWHVIGENSPMSVGVWDANGILLKSNSQMEQLLRNSENSEILADQFQFLIKDSRAHSARILAIIEQTLVHGRYSGAWEYRDSDGHTLVAALTAIASVFGNQRIVIVYVGEFRVRHSSEDAEESVATALRSMLACHLWNANGELLDCNEAALTWFENLSKSELQQRFFEFFAPAAQTEENGKNLDARAVFLYHLNRALQFGKDRFVWSRRSSGSAAGAIIPTEVICKRVRDGEQFLVVSYSRNLVVDYESQICVQQDGDFLRDLLDKAPLGYLIWDESLQLIDCNDEALKLFGFTGKYEFLARFSELLAPVVAAGGENTSTRFYRHLSDVFTFGEATAEMPLGKLNGSPLPVKLYSRRRRIKKLTVVITYIRDMTETRAMIRRIREGDELAKILFDQMPLGAAVWDEKLQIIHNNMSIAKLLGLNAREEFSEYFRELLPERQANGVPSTSLIQENLQQAFTNDRQVFEFNFQTRDHHLVPVEITLLRGTVQQNRIITAYYRDLREHKRMLAAIQENENQLRQACKLAEDNAKAKSDFLDKIGHELRTPLNGILGLLDMLAKTSLDEKQKSFVNKAGLSATSLLRILDDILDLLTIEQGKFTMDFIEFNLSDMLHEIYESILPQFAERNLRLHFDLNLSDEESFVIGDQLRLKQVLVNLLINGLKFTPQGGVELKVRNKSVASNYTMYEFIVSDTGVGLTPTQIVNLFKPFVQADNSVTRQFGGLGLGLTICKEMIEMMDGALNVDSIPGCGSTFRFTAIFNLAVKDKRKNYGPAVVVESRKKWRLLVVDDNEINLMVITSALADSGFEVGSAVNGEEAIEKVNDAISAERHYHAVLMDIQMPVMDGWKATRILRNIPECKYLPIIALSANSLPSDREKSLAAGMNEHLTKPFNLDLVIMTLEKFINKTEREVSSMVTRPPEQRTAE